jgi:hypothetical protein
MAVLLVSAVMLCMVHVDTGEGDDMCAGYGPTIRPVMLLPLVSLGHAHPPTVTAYQPITVERVAPPPEA